ncbi:caspase family protein, partial [bacterium]|nr:caspase family protein [bacterium]
NGFPPESFNFSFNTKAFDPPELVLAKVGISEEGGNGNYKIEPAEVIEVTAIVQNKGFGDAASVKTEVLLSNPNVFLLSEKPVFTLGKIPAGEFREVKFSFTVNKKFEGTSLPVSLKVTEEKGRFGFSKSLGLELNQVTFATKDIKIQKTEQVKNIDFKTLPELTADVDLNLPKTKTENSDAFAVVIGNTNYEKAKPVTFAQNDANSVRRYLIESLGFKEGNIFFVKDARKSDFELYFGSKESFKGKLYNNLKPQKSDVFIFYSGHGAPSLKERKGFFVPVECDPGYVEIQGYSLDVFYENLSKLPAKSVTVVLDACFSGANIFENISPLVLSFESSVFKLKNGVVLSSSSGSQVSSWFEEKKHGLFTYFFLKSIHNGNGDKNRDGKLTFDEIFGFVTDESEGVPYFARKLNGIEQVPVLQGTDKEKVFVVYK